MEWGIASQSLSDDENFGDLHLVKIEQEFALFAVMDAVGQGFQASLPSLITRSILEQNSKKSFEQLFDLCHQGLKNTAGVALGLVRVDRLTSTITWAGVGNVFATLISGPPQAPQNSNFSALVPQVGVLGQSFTQPVATSFSIQKSDLLVMATNGIHQHLTGGFDFTESCQNIASFILARHLGDALVLVARPLS